MARGRHSRKTSPPAVPSARRITREWEFIPRLVVFDLDFTLWNPEMYELDGPPFKKHATTGVVTDRHGEQVHFFPAVHPIFSIIKTDPQFADDDVEIGVASSTTEPQWAKTCMRLMDVEILSAADEDADRAPHKKSLQSLVDYAAIYPRNKRVHFQQLKQESGVEYADMLFLDNEYGNCMEIGRLGVTCSYCPQGLTEGAWVQGMEAYQQAKRKAAREDARAET